MNAIVDHKAFFSGTRAFSQPFGLTEAQRLGVAIEAVGNLRSFVSSFADASKSSSQLMADFTHNAAELTSLFFPWSPAVSFMRAQVKALDDFSAWQETIGFFARPREKQDWDIPTTRINGRDVPVNIETVYEGDFINALHFKVERDQPVPTILLVAPISGHFSTLLRDTVMTLLPDHNVIITDTVDASKIPPGAGKFGFEEYVKTLIDMQVQLTKMGLHPDSMMAVCQPTVGAISAISLMSDDVKLREFLPSSLIVMAGPNDTRESPTAVTELANSHTIEWFQKLIAEVPIGPGAGREVYPGFLQLMAFISMNPERHRKAVTDLADHLKNARAFERAGKSEEALLEREKADGIKTFYKEYFAVASMTAELYLQTVKLVFHEQALAQGTLVIDGKKVDPSKIDKTAVLAVDGAKDDICAPGVNAKVLDWLKGLKNNMKQAILVPLAGHYSVFSGRKFKATAKAIGRFIWIHKQRHFDPTCHCERPNRPRAGTGPLIAAAA